ncbi:MAG: methionyl-tRNA formyltransferase [Verrucomicrobiae bacterium]|nr:methionyl-tRNA formyltransferase [Verrucomicrobiae bacterium]
MSDLLLRCVFFGTAPLACASLAALAKDPAFRVIGVVTQPDRPQGRHLNLKPSPVKELALQLGLQVWQPEKCRDPVFIQLVRENRPDIIVVAAYGQILPQVLLEVPRHGCVNVHASLLPRHRGAAPIQWAILKGDEKTGVTIMLMDAGLDTGPVLSQRETAILDTDDAITLHDRLSVMGAELLIETLPKYVAGQIKPVPQPTEGATHAPKIKKEDGLIRWEESATEVWRRVRALVPWPGAYTFLPSPLGPRLLKVWRAHVDPAGRGAPGKILGADRTGICVACGTGSVRITELQLEGGRRMNAADFLAGHQLIPGMVLGGQGTG